METFLKGCVASASYLISGSPFDSTKTDVDSSESVVTNNNYDKTWKAPIISTETQTLIPQYVSSATNTPPPPPSVLCAPAGEAPLKQAFSANQHRSQGEGWVRPLGYAEKFMTAAHRYGCMATVYSLWLDSRVPLSIDIIKHAATIMYRKMPHLRLMLADRDGRLWWKEMTRETVSVEELDTQDVETAVEELLKRRYNMKEGPLWFTRFIKLNREQDTRDDNHNLKYKYACLFGFHHNVSDGTSNMKFCKVFLQVLNDLLQGKEVEMNQEGTFAPPLQDQLADRIGAYFLFVYMFLRRLYTCILTFGIPVRNFTSRFRMPAHSEASTRVIHHELDEDTTRKLLQRCKMEGVTLNSAFTAAANLQMYKMMAEKNDRLQVTNLWSSQAVNMRRYWPKEQQANSFGCHISLLDVGFPTRREDMESFWKYTRQVHSKLKYHLTESKRALTLQPMSEKLIILIRHNAWLAWLKLPSANDGHYTVTNMGDLTHTFPGTGSEVEVSLVMRSVSCHFMPTLCQNTLQTFRGRFCYSLDYYTQKISKETATTYAQGIMDFLRLSIHSPN